jgi:hypothetical protein
VRAECLDWLLIRNRRHLERVLRVYVDHYNAQRPHRALALQPPHPDAAPPRSTRGEIRRRDKLGGSSTILPSRRVTRDPSNGTLQGFREGARFHADCGGSFDRTNPSTEVHRRPETSTDFVRRWRTIGARFGPSSSQAVPISRLPYGVPGAGRRGPCVRVGRGPSASRLRLSSGLLGSNSRGASRRRQDARVPVRPPDADARGIFLEHLLDHSCPARLRHLFGLDDDPVSGVRPHLCLILLFRLVCALGEASATFLILSRRCTPRPRAYRGGDSRASAIWQAGGKSDRGLCGSTMLFPTPRASGGQAQMLIGWRSSSRRIRSFRSSRVIALSMSWISRRVSDFGVTSSEGCTGLP